MREGRALARAALLGNPSDGYGGRTIAFTFDAFEALVRVRDADATRITGPGRELLRASLERFRRLAGSQAAIEIECETTIPRQVGLGGSSAIVIAALRALADHFGTRLEPGALAALALAVEAEEMGIAAGPQDRVVQAHEGLVDMDFSQPGTDGVGVSESLDPALLPPAFVAYLPGGAEPSSGVHTDLRARFERGDAEVRAILSEIAELADAGRRALIDRDRIALADLLDRNFGARKRLVDLTPRHERMIELAREHDAGANYAGSGGAIVGVPRDPDRLTVLRSAFGDEGYRLLVPKVGASATSVPPARS